MGATKRRVWCRQRGVIVMHMDGTSTLNISGKKQSLPKPERCMKEAACGLNTSAVNNIFASILFIDELTG